MASVTICSDFEAPQNKVFISHLNRIKNKKIHYNHLYKESFIPISTLNLISHRKSKSKCTNLSSSYYADFHKKSEKALYIKVLIKLLFIILQTRNSLTFLTVREYWKNPWYREIMDGYIIDKNCNYKGNL